jgi:hypothetical protein
MSASNWALCPKCSKKYVSKIETAKKALNDAYGKVSIDQYNKLQNEFKNIENADSEDNPEDSLREDYEQGIVDGKYYVSYRASCQECNWSFKYEHSQKIEC